MQRFKTLILLFLWTGFNLRGQKTDVYVLGTVHEKSLINADSIYNFIEGYKPTLILIETDSSKFDPDFRLKPSKFKSNEREAIENYIKNFNSVYLRPFDIKDRPAIMYGEDGVFAREQKLYNSIRKLNKKNKLSLEHSGLFDEYEKVRLKIFEYEDKGLKAINTSTCQKLEKRKREIETTGFLRIVESYKELKQQVESKKLDNNFQLMIEEQMMNNIVKLIEEFRGNRILVIVGNSHKGYIRSELERKSDILEMTLLKFEN